MLATSSQRLNPVRRSFVESLEQRTLLSGLPFDPSFDGDGIVEESDLEVRYEVADQAVQPDGKIIVVGTRMQPGGDDNVFVQRFNADGSIDATFANDGMRVRNIQLDDWASSVAVTNDGKILVAGSYNGDRGSFILSFNADGSTNTSFGNSGSLFTDHGQRDERNNDIVVGPTGTIFVTGYIGHDAFLATYTSAGNIRTRRVVNAGFDDHVGTSIALTTDSGVIVAGNAVNFPNRSQIFVSRFDLNGVDVTLDPEFGTDGTLIANPAPSASSDEITNDVAVQSNGRIIVAGSIDNAGVLLLGVTPQGEVDATFSVDGAFTWSSGRPEYFDDVEILPDDRIVAAGARGGRFLTSRFTADGELDKSFGEDGSVTVAGTQAGRGLAIDDGKIVISGNVISLTFADGIGVSRLDSAGNLDKSFGDKGTTKVYESIRRELNAVVKRSDGKVIAVGQSDEDGRRSFFVTRLHPRGTPDATFGNNGRVVIPFLGGEDNYATDVLLQADGKIVVGGFGNQDFAVVRLNSDGTRDKSFGSNGKAVYNLGGNDRIFDMELQEDGKILAVGRSAAGAVVVRYNSDGSLDETFGIDGVSRPVSNGTYTEIKLDPEGKMVIGGSVPATGGRQFALVRLRRNGTLDTSFGGGGVVRSPFAGGDAEIRSIDIAADGTILAAGDIDDGSEEFGLAKYNPDGTPDDSFSGDGKTKISLTGVQRLLVLDARLRNDGSVVIAGSARTGEYDEVLVAHVQNNGAVDASFGTGGFVSGSLETAGREPNYTDIRAMTLNPDGSLLATARIRPLQVLSYVIIRSRPILSDIDADLSGGVLTVRGDATDDRITINSADGVVTVNINGGIRAFDASDVTRIDAFGEAGNDTITVSGAIPARISGQVGNDNLTGGAGDDVLDGGSGDDEMFGEAGRDIFVGGTGADLFRGGDGKDTADYSSRSGNLTIGIGTFADDGEAGEKDNVYNDIERVIGGSGNDRIKGSAGNNELYGGSGSDTLIGLGGRDALFGQGGSDLLRGNDGVQDYLDGGGGTDIGENDSLDTWFSVEQFI